VGEPALLSEVSNFGEDDKSAFEKGDAFQPPAGVERKSWNASLGPAELDASWIASVLSRSHPNTLATCEFARLRPPRPFVWLLTDATAEDEASRTVKPPISCEARWLLVASVTTELTGCSETMLVE